MASPLSGLLGDHADPAEELMAIFGGEAATAAAAVASAVEWGRRLLAQRGIEPQMQVAAIRAFRQAEPRLSLKPATYLATLIAA
ncbi:hypothetical protein [Rathayibacter iranicus]|uniref:Uncharacterized protein n=2 Tax=Rathayibacter iranicus TaxID=59737 RepID=A0AAD1ENR6_9MICO|nr:hypothetical protein [Rathayibacter iranicus]AZZ56759.1 hypothetical protein C7V51_13390 [Rathayibacter iranicus]MWV31194.1 hypothetical protein [Rathayibacter iranicus NCPPB 2253 = VKM Ac-1602]PPI43101.1 hypothetical protein C5E09_12320 [Rathayibacter iranicus]PPI58350.1 hypothetical protein C5E08_13225 [Rathayibacter iranicus]PPI69249.1 hypothetical protein C5E01_12275 [Rathayibacter iranicus]